MIHRTDVWHTGPGTTAGQYLRLFWQPIHLSRDVEPGRAAPIRIMSEELTLYRGKEGEPHLLDERCAHRGTRLSLGWVEGDAIRCMYHGWKYAPTGQCIEQPGEPQPFCEKIKIRSYPVRDYLGIIWAYLGEGASPEFPRFERFEAPGVKVISNAEFSYFNYFQRMENSHDFSHLPFVHQHAFTSPVASRSLDNAVPRMKSEECEWGIRTRRSDPNGQELIAYFGMPNINYIMSGSPGTESIAGSDSLFIRVPVDDEHHLHFGLVLASKNNSEGTQAYSIKYGSEPIQVNDKERSELVDAVIAGKVHIDEIAYPERARHSVKLTDIERFWVQDNVAMLGQGVQWDRQNEHLGREDAGVILMRKLWARELDALANGRPLKEWHRSAEMVPTVVSRPHAHR